MFIKQADRDYCLHTMGMWYLQLENNKRFLMHFIGSGPFKWILETINFDTVGVPLYMESVGIRLTISDR